MLARYRLPFFIFIALLILTGTFFAIKFASGYQIDFSKKAFFPTGLLVADSVPVGAQVYVNGKLTTATNQTINLEPGSYQVELRKKGYHPWQKTILIEKELVTQTNALLFSLEPDIQTLTDQIAHNPIISPNHSLIAYVVPLTEDQPGLWVTEVSDSLFSLTRNNRQLESSTKTHDLTNASYRWSPDSQYLLLTLNAYHYLISSKGQSTISAPPLSVTEYTQITQGWAKDLAKDQSQKFARVPEAIAQTLRANTANWDFSPDNTKLIYTATASASIPVSLADHLPASSSQVETRQIAPGNIYIYDTKEDKNFLVPYHIETLPTITPAKKNAKTAPIKPSAAAQLTSNTYPLWLSSSRHLFWAKGNQIFVAEYDGSNILPVFTGKISQKAVFASPAANKLIFQSQEDPASPLLYLMSFR